MIKIFLKMKEQYIKTEMEYKFNFWMMIISGVVTKLISLAVPFVIYSNIPSIAGWKAEEIYLIMAYLFISEGLCSVLFQGIWEVPTMVFNGQFDCILTRPISPLFQVVSYGMGLQGVSVVAFGIVAMLYLLIRLNIFNIANIIMSLIFIICGTIICMSLYLIGNSIVFWFDSGGKINIPYIASSIGQYAKYPIEIYSKVVQIILLFILPYAFICVVPVLILRGERTILYMFAQAGVSLVFFFLARTVFYRGIKHYESMGM